MVIAIAEALGYTGMWLKSRIHDYGSNRSYFQIRAMLMGDPDPDHFPRHLSLPYLGYVAYPGYKKFGIVQHNEDGYRGEKVPLEKTGKLRVLCLGGSTTYGSTVDSPGQTYPARLQVLLSNYILHDTLLNKTYAGAEVINGGLEAGNSAEELQQYLFKYRYYKPDVVIVHSGVNDAQIVSKHEPDFQLDYTNYRRINLNLPPLTTSGRWALKSYLISFFTIWLYYEDFAAPGENGHPSFQRHDNQLFCKWTTVNPDTVVSRKQFDYYPFYRNSRSLYESVLRDSARLIVFPNALNKNNKYVIDDKYYVQLNGLNASLSKSLADELGGEYVSFQFDSIRDPSDWVDDCHLTPKGEENKAEILCRAVIHVLRPG